MRRTEAKRNTTRRLIAAGGAMTKMLLPILRTWRVAYQLRLA